ncbi:MAG: hypothetical protein R3E76_10355 [Planctomycetota bacterium]
MSAKSIWLGLAGLWVLAMAAGAVFLLVPERQAPDLPASKVETADTGASDLSSPLEAGASSDEVLPTPVEFPEPESETTAEEAEEGTNNDSFVKRVEDTNPVSTRPDTVVGADKAVTESGSALHTVEVAQGGRLTLPSGEVNVDGDWTNLGTVTAAGTTLVFDGADQTISGNTTAKKIILRGGTKRIRSGTLGSNGSGNAEPGDAGLYVEAGTTLIIEEGGKWNTPNPYGFQIAGSLVIDGGEFTCRFSNGNGTDRGEESWLPGSELTIYRGKFIGSGDADFSGATITIHDGALEINDDIWDTGEVLNIYGGTMRNATRGGMFFMTGAVNITGGELQVYQNSSRSLRIHAEASVYCTGGEISINGQAIRTSSGGIMLGSSATVGNLKINTSTRISSDSTEGAYLSVGGDFEIAKGQKFEAAGHQVIAIIPTGEDQGEFIP